MNYEDFIDVEKENLVKDKKDSPNEFVNRENKSNIENIANEIIKLIIASFGFITALAWNDAFQNLFKNSKYLNSYGPWFYAIIITIITVLILTKIKLIKKYI